MEEDSEEENEDSSISSEDEESEEELKEDPQSLQREKNLRLNKIQKLGGIADVSNLFSSENLEISGLGGK